jgi:hypothetical protein
MTSLLEGILGFDIFGTGNLFGEAPQFVADPRPVAVNGAVSKLRAYGHSVAPAEGVPGLWDVSGHHELTTGQLLDVASKLPWPIHPL